MPGKIQHVLCTGDLREGGVIDYLRGICPDVHVVKGQFDEHGPLPETKVITVGDFNIGVIHGHQIVLWGDLDALAAQQRRRTWTSSSADTPISSRRTSTRIGCWSIRGARRGRTGSLRAEANPGFVLMDVDGPRMTAYVYELVGEEVKVDKVEYSKA